MVSMQHISWFSLKINLFRPIHAINLFDRPGILTKLWSICRDGSITFDKKSTIKLCADDGPIHQTLFSRVNKLYFFISFWHTYSAVSSFIIFRMNAPTIVCNLNLYFDAKIVGCIDWIGPKVAKILNVALCVGYSKFSYCMKA